MPPAASLWPVVFLLTFFQIPLLKLVLVRWCPDVVSMPRVLQFTVIWGADVVSFGSQNVSFGMLVVSTLAPCGIIERSSGTWECKNGDLGVQAWISVDFGRISGPQFKSFQVTFF